LNSESLSPKVINLWGEETKMFWANKNSIKQVTNFLNSSSSKISPLATIARSTSSNFLKNWLGENFTSEELISLFENSSALGLTTSGEIIGVFEGDFSEFFEKLKTAKGKIAASEKIVSLPDTTPGYEISNEDNEPKIEENLFASHKIKTIHFPKYDLSFVQLENLSIFASEKETLEKMISRFVSEEKFLAEDQPEGENIFYARLDQSNNPFLQSFLFVLAELNFESDSVKIDLSFEQ
jgi:hypothetical protein